MAKYQDVVKIIDGVKFTFCEMRKPRKSEKTFDIDKSRYTPWTQGVSNYVNGNKGCIGTVSNVQNSV